ncbi:hypothetical protein BDY19DRAFT_995421 [Irpex rosettiformis]|uniref:Uncharacterized protein n=1 Tax=Irpex rosettiformis TaxID=378272 RepID=A0ACB8TYA1_9APHY|nr:hypothetical protein BDY19DRAFT_995421 [Irpex rosettiformis]
MTVVIASASTSSLSPPISSPSSPTLMLPPPYSPSSASPSYAVNPQEGEQRLELVSRSAHPSTPSATFTTKTRGMTVTFYEQEPGVSAPTYPRNAIIKGSIQFSDEVLSVSLKLEGVQSLSVADSSYRENVLFSEEHPLWDKRDGNAGCPSQHKFKVPFPLNYTTNEGSVPNPPTYFAQYSGSPSLFARVSYKLTVMVTRSVVGSWKRQKCVSIPIHYHPRSRPYLPISPSLYPFLSTFKTRPEDWHQITATIPLKRKGLSGVDCHLFIPSVQIYALTDTIPFHLQLRGPAGTLRKFMGLPDPPVDSIPTRTSTRSSDTSTSTTSTASSSSHAFPSAFRTAASLLGSLSDAIAAHTTSSLRQPLIRVSLLRQTSVTVNAQKAWKNDNLGEATLRPVEHPPSWSPSPSWRVGGEEDELAFDWEGEVKAHETVKIPSFISGDLKVKDFISINLRSAHPESSILASLQHTHAIRFVTDTYRDSFSHPAEDGDQ